MPQKTKTNTMESMAQKFLLQAAQDGKSWMGLLDILAACPGFEAVDQALIYGQRPDARLVARYEDWGNTYHRTVKKDARAIYLFNHDPSDAKKLTVVFDISDTREGYYNRATREAFEPGEEIPGQAVITEDGANKTSEALREEYALPAAGGESLIETIQEASGIEAAESFEDTVNALVEAGDGDFMEIITNGSMIQAFLVKSASYVTSRRLGITADGFTEDDFTFITTMKDAGSILALTGSINEISTPVAELALRHVTLLSQSIAENTPQTEPVPQAPDENEERRNDADRSETANQPVPVQGEPADGDHVPPQGRTLAAEHDNGSGKTGDREVGPDVDPVHEGEPQRPVQQTPDAGRPVYDGDADTDRSGRADPDRSGSDREVAAEERDVPVASQNGGDSSPSGGRGDREEPGVSGEVNNYGHRTRWDENGQASFLWDMPQDPEELPGYTAMEEAYADDPQIPTENEQEEAIIEDTAAQEMEPAEDAEPESISDSATEEIVPEAKEIRLGAGMRFTFRNEKYEVVDVTGPNAEEEQNQGADIQYLIAVNISENPTVNSQYAMEYYGDWASYLGEDTGFTVLEERGEGPFSYDYTTPNDYTKPNLDAGDIVQYGDGHYRVSDVDGESARITLRAITDGQSLAEDINFTMRIPQPYAVLYRSAWPDLIRVRRREQRRSANRETAEQPSERRTNFTVTRENYEEADSAVRISRNISAITTLKEIQSDDRLATRREQDILSQYTGFGGLKEEIEKRRDEFENLVTQSQMSAILAESEKGRSLPAYAVEAIYAKLHEFGFKRGNIIAYGMPDSGFEAMKPKNMKNVTFSAIEDADIPREIFSQLYQRDKITHSTRLMEGNIYDASITVTPYGNNGNLPEDVSYANREGLSLDDYCVAKQLDLVRPGGIVVSICSTNLLDRSETEGRRYLASRASLIGAVRMPEGMFIHTGEETEPCDILFFQKKAVPAPEMPEWLYAQEDPELDGVYYNRYFADHPENVIGVALIQNGRPVTTYSGAQRYTLTDGANPSDALKDALFHVTGTYTRAANISQEDDLFSGSTFIPADPSVRNFTFTVVDNEIYFRENGRMRKIEAGQKKYERIKGMVSIRNLTLDLINAEAQNAEDDVISDLMEQLNDTYDAFVKENEILNSKQNRLVFRDDATYALLCSLENIDEDGNFQSKADIFTQRTIRPSVRPDHVETVVDALAVSMREKGRIDIPFMTRLTGFGEDRILDELGTSAFIDPETGRLIPNDEYLSGNVRQKYAVALAEAVKDERYKKNVEALKQVQPEWINHGNIEVHIGATWIPEEYYTLFMYETFHTSDAFRQDRDGYQAIVARFSEDSNRWNVRHAGMPTHNDTMAYARYGTSRINAYEIFEQSLNLRQVQVRDRVEYINDRGQEAVRYVLNMEETASAREKQAIIEEKFNKWIFDDPDRAADLEQIYNLRFNNIRSRHFDGSYLTFPGMNPSVELMDHQRNGAARIIFSKHNSLLGQVVGAGKTYEMIAGCMERKRLGLSRKALFVVPNHLTAQWGADFYRLYPGAKILVATKRDFQKQNRYDFMSRIATGDYDAVIVGQSKFDRFMPLSKEYILDSLRDRVNSLNNRLSELQTTDENYSYRQSEIEKEVLKTNKKIEELTAAESEEKIITFDQLGIDALYVDEAHEYKNLAFDTKMGNISGITGARSQKTEEMLMKCRYIEQESGGTGIVFATGTPLTNSFTELYTMMRYLEMNELEDMGLSGFDSWASTFGMKEDLFEVTPTGTGFRTISKFSKFYNLPELITLFGEIADIKTRDDVNLPVPRAVYTNIETERSEEQDDLIAEIEERADRIHNGRVDPTEDNMLKITTDGRKIALDQRLLNPLLPEEADSKVKALVDKSLEIYQRTQADRGTQVIFCDQGTPKQGRAFSVYDDVKKKLIERGVPENEIAFVQDYKTEVQKAALFGKVRAGQIRFLMGSTSMMGTGTNIQTRLAALHHLDVPWRPSDIEQREGRIIRQGNRFPQVYIFRYITSGTFDAYNWQILENKQRFISQIMNNKGFARSCEEIDQSVNSYAEVKAICSGNEDIRQQILLTTRLNRLSSIRSAFMKQQEELREREQNQLPRELLLTGQKLDLCREDYEYLHEQQMLSSGTFKCEIDGKIYTDREEAGDKIVKQMRGLYSYDVEKPIGSYMGFELSVRCSIVHQYRKEVVLRHKMPHSCAVAAYAKGEKVIESLDEALGGIGESVFLLETNKRNLEQSIEDARAQLALPFPNEEEYAQIQEELEELKEKIRTASESGNKKGKKKKHKKEKTQAQENNASSEGNAPEENSKEETAVYEVNADLKVHVGDFVVIDATRYTVSEIGDDTLNVEFAAKEGDCDYRDDVIQSISYGETWKDNNTLIRGLYVGAAFKNDDTPEDVITKYRNAAAVENGIQLPFIPPAGETRRRTFRMSASGRQR